MSPASSKPRSGLTGNAILGARARHVLAGTSVAGALEATTTGLHRIRPLHLTFPVFDWNGIALKDAIENRCHVDAETWTPNAPEA